MPFFMVEPMLFTSFTPLKAPIIGVKPVENPNPIKITRFSTLFTNDAAASSSTLCHPIIMLSAKATIITQACPNIIGTPIFNISLICFIFTSQAK